MEHGKTLRFAVSVIQLHTKLCWFQSSRSKTAGEDTFLAAKSVAFQDEGKTHHNVIIRTMCKIYNVNNNKTTNICFYHYIDEII